MPVYMSYEEIFLDIFLKGLCFWYLALFAYRIMASSFCPRLCAKKYYWPFCLALIAVYLLLVRAWEDFSLEHAAVFVGFALVLAPSFILGAIELARKWRWQYVLLSCVVETALFPVWFSMVVLQMLAMEGGD